MHIKNIITKLPTHHDSFCSDQILSRMPKIKNRKAIIHMINDVFTNYLTSEIYSLNFSTPVFSIYSHVEEIEGHYVCCQPNFFFFSAEKRKNYQITKFTN